MQHEYYIGLMSGTSMDGIDAVLIDFQDTPVLLGSYYQPYPSALRSELQELGQAGSNELYRMGQADHDVGILFAQTALQLLQQLNISVAEIQAIGSHGQTIRHHPEIGFTLQIGDPNIIAEHTGCPVVADFRRRDLAAGGQGAPLVPAFHADLWRKSGQHRCILNLGGIANITWLDADPQAPVFGFDTGPANILIDAWMQHYLQCPMDKNGQLARSGSILQPLLNHLLQHPYFLRSWPKSTGRETFNRSWVEESLQQLALTLVAPADIVRTVLELTAITISNAIVQQSPQGELIVCGGGAYNSFLLERLNNLLPGFTLSSSKAFGLAPEHVEAVAFAWLARRRLKELPGNLPEVTGAKGLRCLGAVYNR